MVQGFAYVAIGLAASSFLTFPVAVRLLKPRQPKSLAQAPVLKDIESSIGTQVSYHLATDIYSRHAMMCAPLYHDPCLYEYDDQASEDINDLCRKPIPRLASSQTQMQTAPFPPPTHFASTKPPGEAAPSQAARQRQRRRGARAPLSA